MSHPVCNPFTLHLPMAFAAATTLEVEVPNGQLLKVSLADVRAWLEHRERQARALKPISPSWMQAIEETAQTFASEEVLHGGA